MFDEHHNHQSVNIKPVCCGTLQKSHPQSYFKWFHIHSDYSRNHLEDSPNILQIMVVGEGDCIAEYLPEDKGGEVMETLFGKDHTFGYVEGGVDKRFMTLWIMAVDYMKGGDPLLDKKDLRLATLGDFERFSVSSKGYEDNPRYGFIRERR